MNEAITGIEFNFSMRTESEANKREFWTKRAERAAEQRRTVHLLLLAERAKWKRVLAWGAWNVLLVRISPRELDDDNLRGALKHVRDEITNQLKLPSDRDSRVRWEYGQNYGPGKVPSVRVRVEAMLADPEVT